MEGELDAAALDPLERRALIVGQYADAFHISPLVAERELEEDPDQIGLVIMQQRAYMRAKHAFDRTRDKFALAEAWAGNPYLSLVEAVTFDLHQRRVARAAAASSDGL